MSTHTVRPQYFISGAFHLMWIVQIVLVVFDIHPSDLYYFISSMDGGNTVIFLSVILGASFYIWTAIDSIVSFLFSDKSKVDLSTEGRLAKLFLASMALAGLLNLGMLLWIDIKFYSCKMILSLSLFGIIILAFMFTAAVCQKLNTKK